MEDERNQKGLLDKPLKLGSTIIQHRIVVPPMASHSADEGLPTQKTAGHYAALAANPQVGMAITEHAYIDPQGRADARQLSFADDGVLDAQRALVEAIRKEAPDTILLAQISHAGAHTSTAVTGRQLVSASKVSLKGEMPRALRHDELAEIVERFAAAARRVQEAGYDGVEVHAAHGYLLNQFYSPLTNHRGDEYGPQTVENRIRLACDIVQAVRAATGTAFIVAVRFGGTDFMGGGSTIQDAAEAAPLLEAAGANLIDVSGGLCVYRRPGHREPGYFSDLSRAVRAAVHVPVMVTGGVKTPEQAEHLIAQGASDLVGVGRALFADPTWPANRH